MGKTLVQWFGVKMTREFATEKEATEKAELLNSRKNGKHFCPLIPGTCRTDCECFVKAYVIKKTLYHVFGHDCGNAMFSGDRYNL